MQKPTTERFITFSEFANRLAVTSTELCVLVVRGIVPRPIRIAGKLKFLNADIEEFFEDLRYRRDHNLPFKANLS